MLRTPSYSKPFLRDPCELLCFDDQFHQSKKSTELQHHDKITTQATFTELSLASWYSRLSVKGAFLYTDTCGLGGEEFICMFQKAQECSKILCKFWSGDHRTLRNHNCHCDIVFFSLHGHSFSEAHVGRSRAGCSIALSFLFSQLFPLNLSVILIILFRQMRITTHQMRLSNTSVLLKWGLY